jgi:hypothetical protein
MMHHDEKTGTYTLIMRGAKIEFPTLGGMIDFAKKHYGLNLLTMLN